MHIEAAGFSTVLPNRMAMHVGRSVVPLADQLPTLMDERGLSTSRLAAMVGVNQSHLWRVIRRANKKTISGELAERIALALDLPADWFPETRQTRLFERVRSDIALCDRLYDEFVAPPSPSH